MRFIATLTVLALTAACDSPQFVIEQGDAPKMIEDAETDDADVVELEMDAVDNCIFQLRSAEDDMVVPNGWTFSPTFYVVNHGNCPGAVTHMATRYTVAPNQDAVSWMAEHESASIGSVEMNDVSVGGFVPFVFEDYGTHASLGTWTWYDHDLEPGDSVKIVVGYNELYDAAQNLAPVMVNVKITVSVQFVENDVVVDKTYVANTVVVLN